MVKGEERNRVREPARIAEDLGTKLSHRKKSQMPNRMCSASLRSFAKMRRSVVRDESRFGFQSEDERSPSPLYPLAQLADLLKHLGLLIPAGLGPKHAHIVYR